MLVLGSMPGVTSLRLQQYYGHPQNAFWKIVGAVLGFDPASPYAQRMAALVQCRVALWDVLASCARDGSLDSAIDDASAVANDFAAFFKTHPHIVRVYEVGEREGCPFFTMDFIDGPSLSKRMQDGPLSGRACEVRPAP